MRKVSVCTLTDLNPGFGIWFKSAILVIFPFCQNGTFEPMHEIQNFFGQKHSLEHYENGDKKIFSNMFQGLPNPGFMQEKVQKVHGFC